MDEAWVPGSTTLSLPDYLTLAVLTTALFAIGAWASKGERSTSDFFLAKRSIPWWAVCLSFVATEISAMTVVGVPATAYRENWQYAQFFIGSAAARLVIAYLFIPAFYKYDCTTIYEFLRHRFGPGTQYTASVFFFVTRLLASGVRLMAACVAVKVLLGWPLVPVIALFTLVSVVYIGSGGIKAVIWTNVLQALTFLVAGIATLCFLYSGIEGGLGAVREIAGPAGRLHLWNWGPAFSDPEWLTKFLKDPNIVWIAILNGFFMSMAAFGTDQELMQRLLTVETRAESQRSMLYTIGASLLTLLVFISVGTGLYVWYVQHPAAPLPAKLDEIYPHFAVSQMPAFLRGLVLSAIVMASIDSPLASLTSSFVTDIYRPLIKLRQDALAGLQGRRGHLRVAFGRLPLRPPDRAPRRPGQHRRYGGDGRREPGAARPDGEQGHRLGLELAHHLRHLRHLRADLAPVPLARRAEKARLAAPPLMAS
ncbi:MAG: sodium solute transporter superfamily protein [Elusimicrobia bacterium]|nr:MAG: sodium solute transporter superfamily protein [Elusimicrobiota bacterium]